MSILKSTYSGSQKPITEEWLLNHGWYYKWSFSIGGGPAITDKSHIRRSPKYDNEQLQIVKTEQGETIFYCEEECSVLSTKEYRVHFNMYPKTIIDLDKLMRYWDAKTKKDVEYMANELFHSDFVKTSIISTNAKKTPDEHIEINKCRRDS